MQIVYSGDYLGGPSEGRTKVSQEGKKANGGCSDKQVTAVGNGTQSPWERCEASCGTSENPVTRKPGASMHQGSTLGGELFWPQGC